MIFHHTFVSLCQIHSAFHHIRAWQFFKIFKWRGHLHPLYIRVYLQECFLPFILIPSSHTLGSSLDSSVFPSHVFPPKIWALIFLSGCWLSLNPRVPVSGIPTFIQKQTDPALLFLKRDTNNNRVNSRWHY